MTDNRDIQREIWDGKLPVCFMLFADEIYTMEKPDPFYMLVSRQTYLPLVWEKVQRHFQKFVDSEKIEEFWIEYDNRPLKWHYPVGLLYDLFGCDENLPWNLTVHYQDFPEMDLIHCPSKEAVESYFMSTIKEADALKHRSQVINNMQKKDHKQLFTGLVNDKFDQFWAVNKRLMEHDGEVVFRSIPFKIHQRDKPPIQQIVKPQTDAGADLTLQDLFDDILPGVCAKDEWKILIQGIEIPLESPLYWLSEHLSYPDNFLHICLLQRT